MMERRSGATSEPLKIGITCYPSLGGSGVVATELGKWLAEQGHEIHFITHGLPFRLGHFQKNIYYHEVQVSDYHVFKYAPYDLSLANKMAQVAKMQKLDVLHVHYALPHGICAFLAKQLVGEGLKIVTTLHGTDITVLAQDESIRDMIRLAINQSDAVTAVSQDLIDRTRTLLDIQREIDQIYNFVDERVYYPRNCELQRPEFATEHEKILLHISNFRPVKRGMDVLEIFRKVAHSIPAKLMLVGDGPDLSKMQWKVQELGLEDDVIYLGKQDDVAQIISVADLLLLPSEKESFGLVALEAMACGVPTIGSNAGGIPEVVTHGVTGLLSDVGDTSAMAQHALRLLTDSAFYESYSQAGIVRATKEFNVDQIGRQYESVYHRILNLGQAENGVLMNDYNR